MWKGSAEKAAFRGYRASRLYAVARSFSLKSDVFFLRLRLPVALLSFAFVDPAETSSMLPEIKSKLKNHYRAHRLSFWLNLVPDLHKPGSDDVPRSHHLLDTEQVRSTLFPSSWTLTLNKFLQVFKNRWPFLYFEATSSCTQHFLYTFIYYRCHPGSSRGYQRRRGWLRWRWHSRRGRKTSRQRYQAS